MQAPGFVMCTVVVLLACLALSCQSRRVQCRRSHKQHHLACDLAKQHFMDMKRPMLALLSQHPAVAFKFCYPRPHSHIHNPASVKTFLGSGGPLLSVQQASVPVVQRASLPVLRASSRALPRSGRRASRDEWLILLRCVATDWPLLISAFASLLLAAAGEASLPALQSAVLNAALGLNGVSSSLNSLLMQLCALGVVTSIMCGIRGFLFYMCGARLVARLKKKVFSTLLSQPQAFHDKQGLGEVSSRLATDCEKLGDALSFNVNIALRQTMQTFFALSIVFHINAHFAGLVLTGVALRTLWSKFYAKASRRLAKAKQDAVAVSSGVAEQCMSLIKLVRTHGSQVQETSRYGQQLDTVVNMQTRQGALYGGNFIITGILKWAMHCSVLCLGSVLLTTGQLQRDALTSFVLYTTFISSHSSQVGNNLAFLEAALGAASTVFDYLVPRTPNGTVNKSNVAALHKYLPTEAPLPKDLLPIKIKEIDKNALVGATAATKPGVLVFDGVDFAYPSHPNSTVLEKVSLSVHAGEQVAIVGESGSGKSTLFALALRLYQPTGGRVTFNGVTLDDMDEPTLRSSIAWVQQEPPLFPNKTIRENIAYGLYEVSHEDIEAAAREANAYSFIQKLPGGFETRIDATGSSLSAGQKQRLALARALVRDPALLLLDEATSALDPESEQLVQAAIQRASKRRAVLFTTHKTGQAQHADRIIVMSSGRIVEHGNHLELLKQKGAYARLLGLNASEDIR
mmetsp:Transcript_51116/g.95698  ORF Transcript_51116/g.95698 Transcript_51116/m.95698 type:complete len:742 (-) Transcript_51116:136-2361(-)